MYVYIYVHIYIYIYTYAFFFFGALHCSANTSPIVLRLGAANKPPCWQNLAPGPPLLGSSRTSAHTQYNAVYTDHHSRIQAACGPLPDTQVHKSYQFGGRSPHMADTMCSLIQNTGPAWYPSYGDSLKTDSSKAWSCRQTSMLAEPGTSDPSTIAETDIIESFFV